MTAPSREQLENALLTQQQLIDRIMFTVDGYRYGEWSMHEAIGRIVKLIEANR